MIRIADEIDVAASRNPIILYDIELLTDVKDIEENKKLQAIRSLRMTKEGFVLTAGTDEEAVYASLKKMTEKMQKVLDYCREVIEKKNSLHAHPEKSGVDSARYHRGFVAYPGNRKG